MLRGTNASDNGHSDEMRHHKACKFHRKNNLDHHISVKCQTFVFYFFSKIIMSIIFLARSSHLSKSQNFVFNYFIKIIMSIKK